MDHQEKAPGSVQGTIQGLQSQAASDGRPSRSVQPLGGLAPEPLHVAVVGLIRRAEACAFDRLDGPLVESALDLGVTVGEGEAAGAVVVTGREVGHDRLGQVRRGLHVGAGEAVVDF